MPRPANYLIADYDQDELYIVQNEFGAIKIGRTWDFKRRQTQLRSQERCQIFPIVVISGMGPWEPTVHYQMREFQIFHEWFVGTAKAQTVLSKLLWLPDATPWHSEYDPTGIEHWIERILTTKAKKYSYRPYEPDRVSARAGAVLRRLSAHSPVTPHP